MAAGMKPKSYKTTSSYDLENTAHSFKAVADCLSVDDILRHACDKFGDAIAFESLGVQLTFKTLKVLSERFASALVQDCDCSSGDRIAICLPNLLSFPVALFGAWNVGLTVSPLNPLYTAPEYANILRELRPKVIVVMEAFAQSVGIALDTVYGKIEEGEADTGGRPAVIVVCLGDCLPPVKRLLINSVFRYIKRAVPPFSIPGHFQFRALMEAHTPLHAPLNEQFRAKHNSSLEVAALIQFTGGVTGAPKGASISHTALLSNIGQVSERLEPVFLQNAATANKILLPLPLYHIFALVVGLIFVASGHPTVLVANPRDIPRLAKTLRKSRPQYMVGVDALYAALLDKSDLRRNDLSSLKFGVSGGCALSAATARRWEETFGQALIEGYGLTEASPVVTLSPLDGTHKHGSVGTALAGTALEIRDESGKVLSSGGEGDLYVQGPQVMEGYFNSQEQTQDVLGSDGFLKTGDIARIDEDGFVTICDRSKDLIIVSGFNVYPSEIENAAMNCPGVLGAGCCGLKTALKDVTSEEVALFVVAEPDVTLADLQTGLAHQLTGYKRPKHIHFVDELPKTPVGKVLRRRLIDLLN